MNGWEGIYQVSNTGEVKRFYKNGTTNILKGVKKTGGYKGVSLRSPDKYESALVHRLVAEAFIPNPENKPCVNHKDENKWNNNISNLEWCTYKYNANYGTRNKRQSEAKINNTYNITPIRCVETGVIYPSMQEAQRSTGIHAQAICVCCRGVTYSKRNGFTQRHTAGGYHWEYAE